MFRNVFILAKRSVKVHENPSKSENGLNSDEKIRAIAEALNSFPFYAMLIDEDHRIVYANEKVRQELGLDPEEIVDAYCPKVIHGMDGPYPGCPLEESIERGFVSVEKEFYNEDTKKWVLSCIYPIDFKRKGKRLFIHFIYDITEKKHLEEMQRELRENEEKFRAIFENTPNLVCIVTRDGVIVDANPAFESCFSSPVRGRNLKEIFPEGFARDLVELAHAVSEKGERFTFESSLKQRYFIISALPIEISGERFCLLIGRDVTELKNRESILNILVSVGRILAQEKERMRMIERVCGELSKLPKCIAVRFDLIEGRDVRRIACGQFGFIVEKTDCLNIQNVLELKEKKIMLAKDCPKSCDLKKHAKTEDLGVLSFPLWFDGFAGAISIYFAGLLSDEEIAIFERLSSDISFALRALNLEEMRREALSRIEKNIYQFALLSDRIRNPLSVILGLAELQLPDRFAKKIVEQVDRIKEILEELDRGWTESERIRELLGRI